MDSDSDTDSIVVDEDGNIDWDNVDNIFNKQKKLNEKKEKFQYICKKCGKEFDCENYRGNYPMCLKHRLKD
jgi:hypothetical protein